MRELKREGLTLKEVLPVVARKWPWLNKELESAKSIGEVPIPPETIIAATKVLPGMPEKINVLFNLRACAAI